jgi:hypothetical protein
VRILVPNLTNQNSGPEKSSLNAGIHDGMGMGRGASTGRWFAKACFMFIGGRVLDIGRIGGKTRNCRTWSAVYLGIVYRGYYLSSRRIMVAD